MSNIKETQVLKHSKPGTLRFTLHKSIMPFKEVIVDLTDDAIRVREALALDNYPTIVQSTGTVYIYVEDPDELELLIGRYEIEIEKEIIYLYKT